jgi:hypothetical protein
VSIKGRISKLVKMKDQLDGVRTLSELARRQVPKKGNGGYRRNKKTDSLVKNNDNNSHLNSPNKIGKSRKELRLNQNMFEKE